jgi:DNA primase
MSTAKSHPKEFARYKQDILTKNKLDEVVKDLVQEKISHNPAWSKAYIKDEGSDNPKTVCPCCGGFENNRRFSINMKSRGSDSPYFHCWGCSVAGDVITAVMVFKDYTFKEAIDWLADRVGSKKWNWRDETPEQRAAREHLEKELIYLDSFMTVYAEWAHQYLLSRAPQDVRDHLTNHYGFTDEVIKKCKLGFVPVTPQGQHSLVVQELQKDSRYKHFFAKSDRLFFKTGLFRIHGKRIVDYFEGRITFPYFNRERTQAISIIARLTSDTPSWGTQDPPKYLFPLTYQKEPKETQKYRQLISPHTRTKMFMGMDFNKKADNVLVVEGAPDYVTAIQHGWNAVSPVTTQFKDYDGFVRELKRSRAKGVYIFNDKDEAGQKGAINIARKLNERGLEHVYICEFPVPRAKQQLTESEQDEQKKEELQSQSVDFNEFYARDGGTTKELQAVMDSPKTLADMIIDRLPQNAHLAMGMIEEQLMSLLSHLNGAKRANYKRRIKQQVGKDNIDMQTLNELFKDKAGFEDFQQEDEDQAYDDEIKEMAESFARDPQLLIKMIKAVNHNGVIEERRNIAATVVIVYSALLNFATDEPSCIWGKTTGDPSTGKSQVLKAVTSLKKGICSPKRLFITQSMSSQALAYLPDPETALKNRCIILEEGKELHPRKDGIETDASYNLKMLQSEGHITRTVPIQDQKKKKYVSVNLRIRGPASFLTTSIRTKFEEQFEHRMVSMHPNKDSEQVDKISWVNNNFRLPGVLPQLDSKKREMLRCYHEMLDPLDEAPIIPYEITAKIDEFLMKIERGPRFNRAQKLIPAATQTIAMMYQKQRKQEDGRIVVNIADYHMAHQIFEPFFRESLGMMSDEELKIYSIIKNAARPLTKKEVYRIYDPQASWTTFSDHVTSLVKADCIEWIDRGTGDKTSGKNRKADLTLKATEKPVNEELRYYPTAFAITNDPDWDGGGKLYQQYDLKLDYDTILLYVGLCKDFVHEYIGKDGWLEDFNKRLKRFGWKIERDRYLKDDIRGDPVWMIVSTAKSKREEYRIDSYDFDISAAGLDLDQIIDGDDEFGEAFGEILLDIEKNHNQGES